MQTTNENKPGNTGDLNHPSSENWMGYLYKEISRAERAKLSAHLDECADCRANVQRWENAMLALDESQLMEKRPRFRMPQPLVKWGIAAAVTITIGFGAGRLVSPAAADTRALRASLKSELRTELLAEIQRQQSQALATYQKTSDQQRADEIKTILNAIGKMDVNRQAEFALLRKELETVALHTQYGLQQAQEQIVTLANFSQPDAKLPH